MVDRHGTPAYDAYTAWRAYRGTVDDAVASIVRGLRGRCTTALLSNAPAGMEADLAVLGLSDLFDYVFVSATLGLAKPDPECLRVVLRAMDASPDECVFVDDTAGHVDAASRLGITGVHLRESTDTQRASGVPVCGHGIATRVHGLRPRVQPARQAGAVLAVQHVAPGAGSRRRGRRRAAGGASVQTGAEALGRPA